MSYSTPKQIQNWLQWPTPDAATTDKITRISEATKEVIDSITGQSFDRNNNQMRLVDLPVRSQKVYVGNIISASSVEVRTGSSYTTIASSEYHLGTSRNERPHTFIIFPDRIIPPGYGALRITGDWGWSEVPTTIQQIEIMLASKYILRDQSIQGNVIEEPVKGDIAVNAYSDNDVMDLLNVYKICGVGTQGAYVSG